MGMAHAALVYMGEVEDPVTKSKKIDLSMAEQHIDMLTIMSEKTKGNLNDVELNLLQNILTDLKLKFVRAKRRKNKHEIMDWQNISYSINCLYW